MKEPGIGGVPYYIYGDRYGKETKEQRRGRMQRLTEILRQEQESGLTFGYIFCPCGTGGDADRADLRHLLAGDGKKIIGG